MRGVRQLVFALLFMLSGAFGGAMAAQDELPVEIIDDEYVGVSLAEWDTWATQQVLSLPEAVNPSFDFSGDFCNVGQFGPVFFLPTPSVLAGVPDIETSCTIPAGAAIYLVFHSYACSTIDDPSSLYYGANEEELIACAVEGNARLLEDSVISINGVPVEDSLQYHRISPLYTIQLGPYNAFDMEPSIGLQVQDTYSFIIAPPAPGQYVIDLDNILVGHPSMGHMRWIIDVVEPTVIDPAAAVSGN